MESDTSTNRDPTSRRNFLGTATAVITAAALESGSVTAQARSSRIKAVAFDAFAIFDSRSVFHLAEQLLPGRGVDGNAYEEGLGDAWQPIQRYWREPTLEHRNAIREGLNLEGLRHEYSSGIPDPSLIKPEGYTLDASLLARPGNVDIQLDLFLDYANNVKLYPRWQQYFREAKPPLLAVWGKFDPYFIPPGAEAFKRDNPEATVEFLPTGHFALETHLQQIVTSVRDFLARTTVG